MAYTDSIEISGLSATDIESRQEADSYYQEFNEVSSLSNFLNSTKAAKLAGGIGLQLLKMNSRLSPGKPYPITAETLNTRICDSSPKFIQGVNFVLCPLRCFFDAPVSVVQAELPSIRGKRSKKEKSQSTATLCPVVFALIGNFSEMKLVKTRLGEIAWLGSFRDTPFWKSGLRVFSLRGVKVSPGEVANGAEFAYDDFGHCHTLDSLLNIGDEVVAAKVKGIVSSMQSHSSGVIIRKVLAENDKRISESDLSDYVNAIKCQGVHEHCVAIWQPPEHILIRSPETFVKVMTDFESIKHSTDHPIYAEATGLSFFSTVRFLKQAGNGLLIDVEICPQWQGSGKVAIALFSRNLTGPQIWALAFADDPVDASTVCNVLQIADDVHIKLTRRPLTFRAFHVIGHTLRPWSIERAFRRDVTQVFSSLFFRDYAKTLLEQLAAPDCFKHLFFTVVYPRLASADSVLTYRGLWDLFSARLVRDFSFPARFIFLRHLGLVFVGDPARSQWYSGALRDKFIDDTGFTLPSLRSKPAEAFDFLSERLPMCTSNDSAGLRRYVECVVLPLLSKVCRPENPDVSLEIDFIEDICYQSGDAAMITEALLYRLDVKFSLTCGGITRDVPDIIFFDYDGGRAAQYLFSDITMTARQVPCRSFVQLYAESLKTDSTGHFQQVNRVVIFEGDGPVQTRSICDCPGWLEAQVCKHTFAFDLANLHDTVLFARAASAWLEKVSNGESDELKKRIVRQFGVSLTGDDINVFPQLRLRTRSSTFPDNAPVEKLTHITACSHSSNTPAVASDDLIPSLQMKRKVIFDLPVPRVLEGLSYDHSVLLGERVLAFEQKISIEGPKKPVLSSALTLHCIDPLTAGTRLLFQSLILEYKLAMA
jgi:hypothetical protein